ncbi:hypothetical protein BU17DRAFT_84112 [Hysterangium stoloniferum]|nr:hypothetical protein BU17DRAFT_84112 [Hysterangium stoloniferum]
MPSQRQRPRAKKNRFNPYPSALPDLSGHSHNTYLTPDSNVKDQEDKVPAQAPNSFFCFMQEGRRLYNTDRQAFFERFEIDPEIKRPNFNLPKSMSAAWRKLSETHRKKYKNLAAVRKAEYIAKYPSLKHTKCHKDKKKLTQDEDEETASITLTPVTSPAPTPALSYTSPCSTASARAESSLGPITPSPSASIPPSPWSASRHLANGSPATLMMTLQSVSYPTLEIHKNSDVHNTRSVEAAPRPSSPVDAPFTSPASGGVPLTGSEPSSHTPNEHTDLDADYSSLPSLLDAPGHELDFHHEFMSYRHSDLSFLNHPLAFQYPDPNTHYALKYPVEPSSRLYPLPFETGYEYDSTMASSSPYNGHFNTFASGSNSYSHSHAGPSNSSHPTSRPVSPYSYSDFLSASTNTSAFRHSHPSLHRSLNSYPYLYSDAGPSPEFNPGSRSNPNSVTGGSTPRSGTPVHGELVPALEATHLQAPLGPGAGHRPNLRDVGQVPIPGTLGDGKALDFGVNDSAARKDEWPEQILENCAWDVVEGEQKPEK